MHRCLNIVEVQQTIFREVLEKPQGTATLARLARTCRTLSNTALNVLWARLPSIAYLIRCLPPDLWKIENRKMRFQRPMSRTDWQTFFSYSSRVRSLSDFGGTGSWIFLEDDVVLALSQPPSYGPLLPYLEILDFHWMEPVDAYTPLLQLLLTGSLVTLQLPCFFATLTSPAVLVQLMSRCPSLKRLSFSIEKVFAIIPDTARRKIFSETIMCLDSLQSLECRALNEAAIIHLSRLSSLVELSLVLDDIELEILKPGLASPLTFASLESLTLKTAKLSTLTSLLEVMHFKLRNVSFTTQNTPSPDALRLFCITLVNACDRERLTSISLSAGDDERLSDDEQQISLSTFQPLLAFPNVESFKFDATCDIFFDDDAIETVTKHWPQLISFYLNASSGWGIDSCITHRGLITLLRCPVLREFALEVDFTEIDLPQDQIPESRPGNGFLSHCKRAEFVTSVIYYPITIAAFLSDICPGLRTVVSSWSGEREERAMHRQRWEEVHSLLPAFSTVRRQCFNWCVKRKGDPVAQFEDALSP